MFLGKSLANRPIKEYCNPAFKANACRITNIWTRCFYCYHPFVPLLARAASFKEELYPYGIILFHRRVPNWVDGPNMRVMKRKMPRALVRVCSYSHFSLANEYLASLLADSSNTLCYLWVRGLITAYILGQLIYYTMFANITLPYFLERHLLTLTG